MGFRCIFLWKRFRDKELSKNVFNLNFEDILSKAILNEIDIIRSKYDKKTTYDKAEKWLHNYILCSNCDKKEDCIDADSFCRDVVLAAYDAGAEEVRDLLIFK